MPLAQMTAEDKDRFVRNMVPNGRYFFAQIKEGGELVVIHRSLKTSDGRKILPEFRKAERFYMKGGDSNGKE